MRSLSVSRRSVVLVGLVVWASASAACGSSEQQVLSQGPGENGGVGNDNPGAEVDGGAAGGGGGGCDGVTCSSRGACALVGGTTPACVCNPGYVPSGLACVLPGTVGGDLTLLAGALGGPGYIDGTSNTRFDSPEAVTHDAAGNVYVGGHTLRKISPSGAVSTLAGLAGAGTAGFVDGVGAAARFTKIEHLVVDGSGTIFLIDTVGGIGGNANLRKVTPAGEVTTLAKNFTAFVKGMAIDASGTMWVIDNSVGKAQLSRITPAGVVTKLAISGGSPGPLTVSADGKTGYYIRGQDVVAIDTATGSVTKTLGISVPGGFDQRTDLMGICRDGSNNLWFSESWGRLWRVPMSGGQATLIAGDAAGSTSMDPGPYLDGPGTSARFRDPRGLSCDQAAGKVYVADRGNHTVRAVAMTGNNLVSTLAGTPLALGAVDGAGPSARFRFPQQIVADSAGNWFVADSGNAVIRKVTPAGVVSVFAGKVGEPGLVDGTGTAARFRGTECWVGWNCNVIGLTIDASDNLYVADRGRRIGFTKKREPDAIRRITPAGVVTTLASGSAVGPDDMPQGQLPAPFETIAVDSTNGDIYFNAPEGIRRLRAGVITPVTSGILYEIGMAIDSGRRKLFVANDSAGGFVIARYDLSGPTPALDGTLTSATAPILSKLATYTRAGQLAVAPNGALVVTLPEAHAILRVNPTFTSVDKVGGDFGIYGVELGPLPGRLTQPTGVAFNAAGQMGIVMGRKNGPPGEGALLVTTGFAP